jgi:hypothetical protein
VSPELTDNMKRNFFIIIASLLFFNQSIAQLNAVGIYNDQVVQNWSGEYIRIGPYQVKGSPFLLGQSFPGSITYKGGKVLSDTKVLYDLYHQKAGVDQNNQIFEAADPIEEFTLLLPAKYGGDKLVFKSGYLYGDFKGGTYYNVLADGEKAALLKLFKNKLLPDPANAMAKDKRVFEQYHEYYLYNKITKELHKIKLKEKDVLKALDNEAPVKDHLSKHPVDFSKEDEVINFINQYNNNYGPVEATKQ